MIRKVFFHVVVILLILSASQGLAGADYVTVDISGETNFQISGVYLASPVSPLGGIPFAIPQSGNDMIHLNFLYNPRDNVTLSTNAPDATTAYLLVNTAWGPVGFTAGRVTFNTAGGQSFGLDLVGGQNIRNWHQSNPPYADTVTDPNSTPVFVVNPDLYGGEGRIDMLKVALPASFAGDTVTSIHFRDYGSYWYSTVLISGVTFATTTSPPPCSTTPFSTVDISRETNFRISGVYLASPVSPLGGVPFAIPPSGNDMIHLNFLYDPRNNVTLSANAQNATTAYLLLNTAWGPVGFTAGRVTFNTAGGRSFGLNLVSGQNIRKWHQSNSPAADTVTDPNSTPVFVVNPDLYGGKGRIDMLKVALPASFIGDTVTSVYFRDYGSYWYSTLLISGVTFKTQCDPAPSVPTWSSCTWIDQGPNSGDSQQVSLQTSMSANATEIYVECSGGGCDIL